MVTAVHSTVLLATSDLHTESLPASAPVAVLGNKGPVPVWLIFSSLLLFIAVLSKLLFPEPIIVPVTYSDMRGFAVLAEALLVLWLLFGRPTLALRTITGICFLAFAAYSLWSWFGGAETCACFGSAANVPPWLMVVVDLVVATLALGFSAWRYNFLAIRCVAVK